MHKLLRESVIASVRRRVEQGDCPIEPRVSAETLENALLDTADDLQKALSSPTLHPSDREAIARVISPSTFNYLDFYIKDSGEWRAIRREWEGVLAKADAILALSGSLAPEGGSDEPERMVSEDLAARLDPAPDIQPLGQPKLWQRRSGRPSTEKGETK